MKTVYAINSGKDYIPGTDSEYLWLTVKIDDQLKYIQVGGEGGSFESEAVAKAFDALATELRK